MSTHEEAEVAEKPPVSIWKRLLVAGGVVVVLLVAAGIVQRQLNLARQDKSLREMMAALDEREPGWQLENLAAPPSSLPEQRNSARTVMAAHRLLPRGVPNHQTIEPFLELPPPELLDAKRLEVLEGELRPALGALIEARRLADLPEGRHRVILASNPIATLLPDQQDTRAIAGLLQLDALLLAQKGNSKEALRSSRALLNAGRSLGDEPFLVSQLIRIACVSLACSSIERTLALGEPPAAESVELQKLLAREEAHPTLLVGLRGERAMMHELFTGIAKGTMSMKGLGISHDGWWTFREDYLGWTMRDLARREHPKMMEMMGKAIDNARLPTHEQRAAEKALENEVKALSGNSLIRLVMPATQKVAEASRRKLAQVRCVQVLLALEQHRQAKGGWPMKLEELTPKLLPAVPLDPFDGKALRYLKLADGVAVYSVGPDGKDDGGAIKSRPGGLPPTDVGYRLWDVKHRRQTAKPPAGKP
jgi:hypothetical protein